VSDTKTTVHSSGGVGFAGLLTLLFIGLKLGHIIDWSWLWVLSPLWIGVGLVLTILLGTLAAAGLAFLAVFLFSCWMDRKSKRGGRK
jgi:hypothetical protein